MKKIYSLVLFVLFLVFGMSLPAYALTVSPPIIEISADPGSTVTGEIKLFNESDRTQTFFTSFENFEPSDETGTPRFVGSEDGLATWLSTTGSVTLAAKEEILVPYTLSIPNEIEPGGYFAATFFGTQPPAIDESQVSIGGRLGVLMLLRVNGDIPEDGGLLEYQTVDNHSFYVMPPVEFEYRFSNNGGDRVVPRGDIEIKNTFGKVRETISANLQEGSVLPDSARRFKPKWQPEIEQPETFFEIIQYQWRNFHFGFYTAEINLGWGFTNQTANNSIGFFIFPWQLLLVLIVVFVLVWIFLKVGTRAYKKSLIKQLEKMQQAQESASE